ncbi:MAG: DMT family protein [Hymenobacteraceae bacterium]|nr:DMT family protein [Hymenobacteraceae bacterium]MDX5396139.1 DMT family protein [Hymenobacteraceae bacterium]MDX5512200.1 DMT family protein [Hymenobacteraceae bacterium]
MKGLYSILLLVLSNLFMTLAWYGHLHFKQIPWLKNVGLAGVILISWGLAFFEYIFQVPANKIGFEGNNGPYSLFELKMLQEVVSLLVFTLVTVFIFRSDKLAWNHLVGFFFLVIAVFFVFKKW